ncbi:hypothetical protein QFW82_00435 [Streptomyces malaysiensis subsp. malaysiensis]|uniref:hypothetical protein n=1 Tax=Streptomyces malaysiensis TaxID=92644 RepID=UPI0024BF641D|nr:hypothetical protein [Streptomyces sp. NA07423]WHX15599.1 hypothetical protein QFW82_00435 [Streptomyces sp. NA07423]
MRDANSGQLITNLLLNRADDLDDLVLLACLDSAFPKDAGKEADPDDLYSGVLGATLTLGRLVKIIERHPRAFLLHGPTLREVIAAATGELTREIREEGIYESSWDVFEALANVCTSPALLADAAQCLSQATPPTWQQRQLPTPKWTAARSQAADALAHNPFCPAGALALLAPLLSEATAAHFVEHSDEQVRDAATCIVDQAVERIHRTGPAAPKQRNLLTGPTVPTDDILAQQDDPAAALSAFLPLKARQNAAARPLEPVFKLAPSGRDLPAEAELIGVD